MGHCIASAEQGDRNIRGRLVEKEEFRQEFLEKGIDYTRGYIEGRKWRLSNLVNLRYHAAKEALGPLEKLDALTDVLIEAIEVYG
jgi:hypothetical protein